MSRIRKRIKAKSLSGARYAQKHQGAVIDRKTLKKRLETRQIKSQDEKERVTELLFHFTPHGHNLMSWDMHYWPHYFQMQKLRPFKFTPQWARIPNLGHMITAHALIFWLCGRRHNNFLKTRLDKLSPQKEREHLPSLLFVCFLASKFPPQISSNLELH